MRNDSVDLKTCSGNYLTRTARHVTHEHQTNVAFILNNHTHHNNADITVETLTTKLGIAQKTTTMRTPCRDLRGSAANVDYDAEIVYKIYRLDLDVGNYDETRLSNNRLKKIGWVKLNK